MSKGKLAKTEYCIETSADVSFRFALLSDLHRGDGEEAAQIIREDPPDFILLAGDLYESPPRNPFDTVGFSRLLSLLPDGIPTFYCRGNHDRTPSEQIDELLQKKGVKELTSSYANVGPILIGGLDSALYSGGIPDMDFLNSFSKSEGYKILISHHPEYYPSFIKQFPIDLTVSGHAHGGQWALFGRGLWAPGQGLFPKYTHGIYENRLVVSRGLSNSVRIPRIGTPTEVVYVKSTAWKHPEFHFMNEKRKTNEDN